MIIALIGLFSGILSGMGVGGGMILIPSLIFFTSLSQHAAQSINLYYFVPTAISAIIMHTKNKNIEKKAALPLIIWGVPFSLLGAYTALRLSSGILNKCFAVFLFVFGIGEVIKGIKSLKIRENDTKTH